jgi:hypothetical protein
MAGGWEGREDGGKLLYICKGPHPTKGGEHPGKIRPEFGGCFIGYGGREVPIGIYDVAVAQ